MELGSRRENDRIQICRQDERKAVSTGGRQKMKKKLLIS